LKPGTFCNSTAVVDCTVSSYKTSSLKLKL